MAAPASPLPPTGVDGITGACAIEISGGFVEVRGTGAAGCNVTEPGERVVVGLTASVDVSSGGFVEVSGTGAAGCNVTEPGEIVVVGLTASVDVI